jgi:hypothetical protein
MFRAYITKYTREFDAKHNLEKLYEKSQIGTLLEQEEKEEDYCTRSGQSENRLQRHT